MEVQLQHWSRITPVTMPTQQQLARRSGAVSTAAPMDRDLG
ncbi:hypothetical protein AG0111_0g52 [Alternaria gaisen]|uniref:Uncharacterized protein n=1 Tax=Alternaria gaisen TaxID=167740 RepID=A0ACB6G163_9PLEO|nr:hypothetical protein AG0111_0g52 [Alternaria gaisen]